MNGRATESGGANGGGRRVSHFMKAPAAVALLRNSAWRSECAEDRADGAAKGKASAIEEALRILGRGGGADRERERRRKRGDREG